MKNLQHDLEQWHQSSEKGQDSQLQTPELPKPFLKGF